MADPGIDRRVVREGVWEACPHLCLELVMQWPIQELTEGAREGGLGACPPGMFRVSNAVADLGIDGMMVYQTSEGL